MNELSVHYIDSQVYMEMTGYVVILTLESAEPPLVSVELSEMSQLVVSWLRLLWKISKVANHLANSLEAI